MKIKCLLLFMLLLGKICNGQTLESIASLDNLINESSGLIYLNQKVITHNDSGGEAALYELDSISGNVTRKVVIANATNVDWEDLCYDDSYIYIADIGNNSGTRTDLKIYRLQIAEYFNTPTDTVDSDIILFNYSDQVDFTPATYTTNYDAEALIAYNDSLYIFTKNWIDNQTNIYVIPKVPGTYQGKKIDQIDSQGLVTSATFQAGSNLVLLTGYTLFSAFVIRLSNFTSDSFSTGTIDRFVLDVPVTYSYQVEGIGSITQNEFYLTSEKSEIGSSGIFRLTIENLVSTKLISDMEYQIYPNPASNKLHVVFENLSLIEIYDGRGSLRKTSVDKIIDISDLKSGTYVVVIKSKRGESLKRKLLIN